MVSHASLLLLPAWKQQQQQQRDSRVLFVMIVPQRIPRDSRPVKLWVCATSTVDCSSRQHTAGSTFLGTDAIMIQSPWSPVPSTLNCRPSRWTPVRRRWAFPANDCAALPALFTPACPPLRDRGKLNPQGGWRAFLHGLGAYLERISRLWVELQHPREPKNISLDGATR